MAAAEPPIRTPEKRESFFAAIARHRRSPVTILVMVSIALSGIFTRLPTMILHAILR